ncbi:MAG: hypothetical protein RR837_11780 [Bacteroidales bacterium]
MKTTQIDGAILTPETIEILKTIQESGNGFTPELERSIDLLIAGFNGETLDADKVLRSISSLRFVRDMLKSIASAPEKR